jgi:hypothetical protein
VLRSSPSLYNTTIFLFIDSRAGKRTGKTRKISRYVHVICNVFGCPYFIYVTNDHGYVPFVVITIWFFPHSWFVSGFLTRVAWRVPHVEQEQLTVPGHISSTPVFSEDDLWFFVQCFVFFCLFFSFRHLFCRSFFDLLPLSYLQRFLLSNW